MFLNEIIDDISGHEKFIMLSITYLQVVPSDKTSQVRT